MSDVPEEAREAYENGRWCGECRYGVVADPPCCYTDADTERSIPVEVAAERQRLHDHVEADALAVLDKYDITLTHGSWREILTELTALVSPVSDDTGRTLCPKCKGKRTVPPVSPGLPVLCSRCTGMGTVPVSDDTGGTKP